MSGRAQARLLPGGRRLHLQDGPIDLVIEAWGKPEAVAEAYRASITAFEGLLDALCAELPLLRTQVVAAGRGSVLPPLSGEGGEAKLASLRSQRKLGCGGRDGWGSTALSLQPHPSALRAATFPWQGKEDSASTAMSDTCLVHEPVDPVARRMVRAVAPFAAETFVTPMAAVAGAVADHVLAAMTAAAPLARAYVNNGGDIALHVAPGERLRIGLVDRPDRPSLLGHVAIAGGDGIGGVATSGWRGRSFSLGIADAVTVLARSAAEADAAATIVANAVDLPGHPAVVRSPADSIAPDSDLGSRLVTGYVGPLTEAEVVAALSAGLARAEDLLARGLILGAAIQVQGHVRVAPRHIGHGTVILPLSGEGGSAKLASLRSQRKLGCGGRDGWGSPARSAALRTPPVALRAPPSPGRGGRTILGAMRHDIPESLHA